MEVLKKLPTSDSIVKDEVAGSDGGIQESRKVITKSQMLYLYIR